MCDLAVRPDQEEQETQSSGKDLQRQELVPDSQNLPVHSIQSLPLLPPRLRRRLFLIPSREQSDPVLPLLPLLLLQRIQTLLRLEEDPNPLQNEEKPCDPDPEPDEEIRETEDPQTPAQIHSCQDQDPVHETVQGLHQSRGDPFPDPALESGSESDEAERGSQNPLREGEHREQSIRPREGEDDSHEGHRAWIDTDQGCEGNTEEQRSLEDREMEWIHGIVQPQNTDAPEHTPGTQEDPVLDTGLEHGAEEETETEIGQLETEQEQQDVPTREKGEEESPVLRSGGGGGGGCGDGMTLLWKEAREEEREEGQDTRADGGENA